MRIGIFFVTVLATIMGITIETVYGLWFLCADLVYVVLFPQLCCVVYLKSTNTYGSFCAYWIGLILRILGGDAILHIPATIKYPFYDHVNNKQLFPFRTFAMLATFFTTITVSYLTKFLFENEYLRKEYDIFTCVTNIPQEAIALNESHTLDELSKLNISRINTDINLHLNSETKPKNLNESHENETTNVK
jgi:solute carrier family 5 (high affinity choline transporter), member 7